MLRYRLLLHWHDSHRNRSGLGEILSAEQHPPVLPLAVYPVEFPWYTFFDIG